MTKFKNQIVIFLMLVLILSSDIITHDHSPKTDQNPRKRCTGYTIVEFGKGIDCNADTIKLGRKYGMQAFVIH